MWFNAFYRCTYIYVRVIVIYCISTSFLFKGKSLFYNKKINKENIHFYVYIHTYIRYSKFNVLYCNHFSINKKK